MIIETLFFGITRDVVGLNKVSFDLKDGINVGEFQNILSQTYPGFKDIKEYAVALNEEYVTKEHPIKNNDTLAIIPPVSGG